VAGGDNLGAEAEGAGIARADGIADESTMERKPESCGKKTILIQISINVHENFNMIAELSDEYQEVVDKVRNVVKMFR
jgi:hypothetical protein